MLTAPCPDCGAEPAGAVVRHVSACPLVRSISTQADADTEWFQRHPDQDRFLRVATVAEREVFGGDLVEVVRRVLGGDGG